MFYLNWEPVSKSQGAQIPSHTRMWCNSLVLEYVCLAKSLFVIVIQIRGPCFVDKKNTKREKYFQIERKDFPGRSLKKLKTFDNWDGTSGVPCS